MPHHLILTPFVSKALEDGLVALRPEATLEEMQTAIKHLYVATSALRQELETANLIIETLDQRK